VLFAGRGGFGHFPAHIHVEENPFPGLVDSESFTFLVDSGAAPAAGRSLLSVPRPPAAGWFPIPF